MDSIAYMRYFSQILKKRLHIIALGAFVFGVLVVPSHSFAFVTFTPVAVSPSRASSFSLVMPDTITSFCLQSAASQNCGGTAVPIGGYFEVDMTGIPSGDYWYWGNWLGGLVASSTLFHWDGSSLYNTLEAGYFGNQINSVSPYDKQTGVATTTNVTVTGYISPLEVGNNPYITVFLTNVGCSSQSGNVIDAFNTCNKTLTFRGAVPGSFSTSTSITLDFSGVWTMVSAIKTDSYCFAGYCFSNNTRVSTTTSFTLGMPNAVDLFYASTTPVIAQLSDIDISRCTPWSGSFNMAACLAILFVPDSAHLSKLMGNVKDNVLTLAPVGYLTRFISILSNSATTSLPAYTVHIFTGQGATTSLSFDMQDMIAGGGTLLNSIKDPQTGLDAEEILRPIVQLFVALSVILIIVRDVTGAHRHT